MNQTQPTVRHRAHVASLTPGRLRIKMHPGHRDEATLRKLQADLQATEGVRAVRANAANGSLTLNYDPDRHSASGILGVLEDVDVMIETIGDLPSVGGDKPDGGATSPSFLAAVEDLNRRINRATGIPLDLKLALPLSFVGAGLWSISRRGLMIESVPGGLFFWFAFDMFVKLHPVPHPPPSSARSPSGEWERA